MSISTLTPRPNQVSELTRGLDLPLTKINDALMMVIVETISVAFSDISERCPEDVTCGTEPEVTALLISRLNAMTDDIGLWRRLVRCVGRGDESMSFDGKHIEKRPDLSIWLTKRSARFPLVAEAKVIDIANQKSEVLYSSNGVRRFLDGEYGWGGREALMLGYVRDASTIANRLTPYLAHAGNAIAYAVEIGPIQVTVAIDCARSQHGRGFVYSHLPIPGKLPGSIALWHLWLKST